MVSVPDEVSRLTKACVQDLLKCDCLSFKRIASIMDANRAACEEIQKQCDARCAELKKLFSTGRRELRSVWIAGARADSSTGGSFGGEEPGLFSDILSSLGFGSSSVFGADSSANLPNAFGAMPSGSLPATGGAAAGRAVARTPSASRKASVAPGRERSMSRLDAHDTVWDGSADSEPNLHVDIDGALEAIEHGPRLALRDSANLLGMFERLRRRYEKLQASWPQHREAVKRSLNFQEPLEVRSLVETFNESLSWQDLARQTQEEADVACGRLGDALEWNRDAEKQRVDLLSARRSILRSMGKVASARASALLWIRGRARGRTGSCSEVTDALRRNLRLADALEQQLRSCASAVMQVESNHEAVRNCVRRLSEMKLALSAAADKLALASGASEVLKAKPGGLEGDVDMEEVDGGQLLASALESNADAMDEALRELVDAIDFVTDVLRGCPLSNRGFGKHTSAEEVQAFRRWASDELIGDDDQESESDSD